jgi:alpha-D-xyloside xylohydrolase
VAPVFDDQDQPVRHRFYVPGGSWTDLRTDETFTGPAFHTALVPLDHMPVLVRDGAVIPRIAVTPDLRNTDDALTLPWTLHGYGQVEGNHTVTGFDRTPTSVTITGQAVTSTGTQELSPTVVPHG